MKSLNDLFQEAKNDKKIISEWFESLKTGKIDAFLKDHECDSTAEEALKFIENIKNTGKEELTEDELALIAGGKGSKSGPEPKYKVGMYIEFFIPSQVEQGGMGIIVGIEKKHGEWHYRIGTGSYVEECNIWSASWG